MKSSRRPSSRPYPVLRNLQVRDTAEMQISSYAPVLYASGMEDVMGDAVDQ